MDNIAETAAKVVEQQTGTPEPSTIPPTIAGFEWGYEGYNAETREALTTVQTFVARMVADELNWRKERSRIESEYLDACDLAKDAGAPSPNSPRCYPDLPGNWLTLMGRSGCGKTHLAGRVARWRANRGQGTRGIFYKWLTLIEDCRNGDTSKVMARVGQAKLMVIDDAGSGHDTDFSHSILSEICERRIGLYTVWTSNLGLEQFAEIDNRIASRIIRDRNQHFTFRETGDYALR